MLFDIVKLGGLLIKLYKGDEIVRKREMCYPLFDRCPMKKHKSKKSWVHDDGGRKAAGFKGDAGRLRDPRDGYRNPQAIPRGSRGDRGRTYDLCNRRQKRPRCLARRQGACERHCWGPRSKQSDLAAVPARVGMAADQNHRGGRQAPMWKDVAFPPSRLVVELHGHLVAVVDGIAHDTFD